MKRCLSFIFALFCCLAFSSCYKIEVEANNLPQGYSVAQIVGTWKIIGISSNKARDWDGNGTNETDIYNTWSDCQKNNLYEFNSDYSGTYKMSCNDIKPGSWYLNGITLTLTPNGFGPQPEKIIYLITDTFKTTSTVTVNGQNYTITKVWKFQ